MKTNNTLERLYKAVKLHYNNGVEEDNIEFCSMLLDVHNNGADGGYCRFSYTRDTNEFFDKNRKLIVHHLINVCNDTGLSIIEFAKQWKCMKGMLETAQDEYALMCILSGAKTSHENASILKNNLCWLAIEEVANWAVENGIVEEERSKKNEKPKIQCNR